MESTGREQQADRLYEKYGKPLERDHWGEYVAIYDDGRTMVGSDMRELLVESTTRFGKGGVIFKIGPRTVGSWR